MVSTLLGNGPHHGAVDRSEVALRDFHDLPAAYIVVGLQHLLEEWVAGHGERLEAANLHGHVQDSLILEQEGRPQLHPNPAQIHSTHPPAAEFGNLLADHGFHRRRIGALTELQDDPEDTWIEAGLVDRIHIRHLLLIQNQSSVQPRAPRRTQGRHLPVVRELYVALKQLTEFLKPDNARQGGQVVSVRHPDFAVSMVGLLMRRDVDDLDDRIASGDYVAVYLPLSYQIGGYTLFMPRDWVTPVDMSVEKAMRASLTGWMQVRDED